MLGLLFRISVHNIPNSGEIKIDIYYYVYVYDFLSYIALNTQDKVATKIFKKWNFLERNFFSGFQYYLKLSIVIIKRKKCQILNLFFIKAASKLVINMLPFLHKSKNYF